MTANDNKNNPCTLCVLKEIYGFDTTKPEVSYKVSFIKETLESAKNKLVHDHYPDFLIALIAYLSGCEAREDNIFEHIKKGIASFDELKKESLK